MSTADLHTSDADGIVTAVLSGEIDMSNASELESTITKATPNEMLGVVLDLTSVAYLDSSGIHLLYKLRESLRMRGQQLRLVIPADSPARDALRLAGVEQHMEIVEAVPEALELVRAQRPQPT